MHQGAHFVWLAALTLYGDVGLTALLKILITEPVLYPMSFKMYITCDIYSMATNITS